jgi:hypothetical protein
MSLRGFSVRGCLGRAAEVARLRAVAGHTLLQAALLLALSALMASGDVGEQKLIGYWRFDESDRLTVEDSSGNGRHGDILNESRGVKRVPGRNGGAVEFIGGDPQARNQAGCIALRGFEEVDWSKGLTIELWVRFTNLVRPNTYELVSNTQSDRGLGFRFMVSWSSLWLRSGEGGDGKTWGAQSDPTTTSLRTGEWYHLTGTYDGSIFRGYVDGELVGESTAGLPLTRGDNTIFVGAYRGGYAYGLDGVVDDLRLYNYPRSATQIVRDAKLGD